MKRMVMNFNICFCYLKRLIIFCAFVLIGIVSAYANDQENAKDKYPDVWFRLGGDHEVLYPQEGDRHFLLPNGKSDVVILRYEDDKHGRRVAQMLETFFGGKKFRIKDFNKSNLSDLVVTLKNGEKVHFSILPPWNKKVETSTREYISSAGQKKIINIWHWLPDGSSIGFERLFYDPPGHPELGGSQFKCEQPTTGIIRQDASGKAVWRRTIVELMLSERKGKDPIGCLLVSRQRYLFEPSAIHWLPDNSLLLEVGMLVRIDSATGLSKKLPQTVRNVDSENFLAFKNALYNRLESKEVWDTYWRLNLMGKSEASNSLMIQYFFFPEQLLQNKD